MATAVKDFLTDEEMAALEGGGVPDFISDEEMAKLEPAPMETPQNPSFGDRLAAAGQEPFTKMRETAKGVAEGSISKPEGILRSMGDIAGGAGKIAGEYIPGFVKRGAKRFADVTGLTADVGTLIKDVKPTAERYPNTMRNLGAIGNIAGLAAGTGIGAPIAKTAAKGAAEGLGEGIIKASGRVQGTKVKINIPEMKKGASNEMYPKYGVFGNAQKVKDQWQTNINGLYGQVKDKISTAANDPENYASIDDVFAAAKGSAEKYGKSRTAISDIHAQLDNLKAKFDAAYPDGRINILDAQVEKQVVGKKGDWLARSGQISGNPEASVSSQAHNALYDALKTNVENKGSAGIRELNKQISEMIPMERAAAKQVLVQNRKNLIPIDDYIGALAVAGSAASGNFLPAAVVGANVLSKSPTVAKTLYTVGKALKGKKPVKPPRTPKEILGGESGFVGSRYETGNAVFDKFMGKEITPKMEAYLKEPKTIAEMRTALERLAPKERSAMISRLKKIYGTDYNQLFGTLAAGVGVPLAALTGYGLYKNKGKKLSEIGR